jgi:peptidoglycan/xylan/chitin deacetylase (PgdA/CDA1 family)
LNLKYHISNLLFRYDLWRAKKDQLPPPGLRMYVFHSLFESEAERDAGLVFPHEGITVSQFEAFVKWNVKRGVRIVGPEVLDKKAEKMDEPAILISFDDGYANNLRALPVLERYEVPALFCVVTKNILEQKPFWWDVVVRRLKSGGRKLLEARKQFLPEENEAWMLEQFGKSAVLSDVEIGRPLRVEELKAFASHPLVHIGNHSHSHPLFTQITEARMHNEMESSQGLLREWLGKAPAVMAWPNGSFSRQAEEVASKYGIRYALSTQRRWYDLSADLPFSPGRVPLYGIRNIASQLTVHEHRGSRWW